MQVTKNNIWLDPEPFDGKKLSDMVSNKEVERVEVFEATDENMQHAHDRTGKIYKRSSGYKKAPKIRKR